MHQTEFLESNIANSHVEQGTKDVSITLNDMNVFFLIFLFYRIYFFNLYVFGAGTQLFVSFLTLFQLPTTYCQMKYQNVHFKGKVVVLCDTDFV